jgi:outer membrane protein assembly factor BamA
MRVALLVVVFGTWAAVRLVPEEASAEVVHPVTSAPNAVKGIALDGRNLPVSDLRAVLGTEVGHAVDTHQLDLDREAITMTLAARGYLAAKVSTAITPGVDGTYVVFDIETGPMFRVRSIEVTGPGERFESAVKLVAGEEANESRIARSRQALADLLTRRNAGKVTVEVELHPNPATATVDVELSTRITTITTSKLTFVPASR